MILTLGGTGWFNHRGVCHHSLSLYICCNGGSTLLGDSYHAFVPFHVQLCGASSVVSTVACSKETIKFLILQSGPYYSIMSRIRWSQNVHNCEWYHCSNEHITAVILNHLQLCNPVTRHARILATCLDNTGQPTCTWEFRTDFNRFVPMKYPVFYNMRLEEDRHNDV